MRKLFLERFPDAMGCEVGTRRGFSEPKSHYGARSIRDIYRKMLRRKSCVKSSSAGDIDCENGCCSAKRQDAIECGVL
jgi:hypothetical protein